MKKGELYSVNEVHRELEREDLLKIIKQELKKNPHIIAVFYSDFIRRVLRVRPSFESCRSTSILSGDITT